MTAPGQSHRSTDPIRYFDTAAADYLGRYSAATPGGQAFRERKKRVLDMLGDCGGRVLDVGCGPGVMALDLVAKGCVFVGVDASKRMVEEGKRRFADFDAVSFLAAQAGALPWRDDSFDVVLCMGVIDRIPDPARAVREMGRVLRPGGTLLISFPNLASPYAAWRSFMFLPMLGVLKRALQAVRSGPATPAMLSHARLWTRRSAHRLVSSSVGPVDDVASLNFNLLLSPLDEMLPRMAMRVAERAQWLGRTPLRCLGAAFLVRATKEPASADS